MLTNEAERQARPNSEFMDSILGVTQPVLDHGFVRVVDYLGDDDAVVQAARVSYGRGTKTALEDASLIDYLMRRWHTTPFEMCEIKLHCKLPIFIARQWIRHRTANVNEYSARYSILDKEFHFPTREELAAQSTTNNQGRGGDMGEEERGDILREMLRGSEESWDRYQFLLNEGDHHDPNRSGLARESARAVLPLNTYTQWYWKTDLHNLLHFLRLRKDPHAQKEIRDYADVIGGMVEGWVPATWEAFVRHRLEGASLSRDALRAVRRRLAGEDVGLANSGLSRREWNEVAASTGFWEPVGTEK